MCEVVPGLRNHHTCGGVLRMCINITLTLKKYNFACGGKTLIWRSAAACDEEVRRCQKAINQFFHLTGIFVVSDAVPFLLWLELQGHEKAMKKTTKDLDQILGGRLEEHRQRRLKSNCDKVKAKGVEEARRTSLLSCCLFSNKESSPTFSMTAYVYLSVILGGSDMKSSTLMWAISVMPRTINFLLVLPLLTKE
ncbi:putative cytochrome P450 [Rosa chinensis]|uniref:Putative cytochrome P450 n=1 Tax=Rosa chinensis TaxID=74649 RepID=A0A2P6PYF9_ROSCH|nr:putative cytochrome P450 [Rosa chinensis]